MATGNLIKKKEEFELWLKSQIAKGCDLLKREVSEDDTTIVRYRTIVKIKEYDEDEKNSFLADYKKWDSYNSELISRSFDDNDSPQSYYRVYGRTGDPTRLFGEDIIKEAKQQINEIIRRRTTTHSGYCPYKLYAEIDFTLSRPHSPALFAVFDLYS